MGSASDPLADPARAAPPGQEIDTNTKLGAQKIKHDLFGIIKRDFLSGFRARVDVRDRWHPWVEDPKTLEKEGDVHSLWITVDKSRGSL
jgi:hypothetical protein